jgi:hypothetical protein
MGQKKLPLHVILQENGGLTFEFPEKISWDPNPNDDCFHNVESFFIEPAYTSFDISRSIYIYPFLKNDLKKRCEIRFWSSSFVHEPLKGISLRDNDVDNYFYSFSPSIYAIRHPAFRYLKVNLHRFIEKSKTSEVNVCVYDNHNTFVANLNTISGEVESITFQGGNMTIFDFFDASYECNERSGFSKDVRKYA